MASGTPTTNLSLRTMTDADSVDAQDINYNSGILDTKIGAVGSTSLQSQIDATNTNLSKIVKANGTVNLSSYTAKTFIDSIVSSGYKIYYCSANSSGKLSDLPITQAGVYIVHADTYYKTLDFIGTNGYDYHYDYTSNAWTSLNANITSVFSTLQNGKLAEYSWNIANTVPTASEIAAFFTEHSTISGPFVVNFAMNSGASSRTGLIFHAASAKYGAGILFSYYGSMYYKVINNNSTITLEAIKDVGIKVIGMSKEQELTQNSMQYVEWTVNIPDGYRILTAYDSSYLAGVMGSVARISQSASRVGVNYYCTASSGTKNLYINVVYIKSSMIVD